jgi:hypothetical protein
MFIFDFNLLNLNAGLKQHKTRSTHITMNIFIQCAYKSNNRNYENTQTPEHLSSNIVKNVKKMLA